MAAPLDRRTLEEKWKANAPVVDTCLSMLEEDIMCDVTFLAGEAKQEVKAHRFMLVSRSPVFFAMFNGPLAEKSEYIEIPDIKANILEALLRYIYGGIPKMDIDTVIPLMYAANKYAVYGMLQECGKFLKSKITSESVCTMVEHLHYLFHDKTILEDCQSIITAHGEDVFTSSGFLSLTKEGLRRILELDESMVREEVIFTHCIRWAKEQCKRNNQEGNDMEIREALGELLYLIRFTSMSQEHFALNISNTKILSEEEKIDVFRQFSSKRAVGEIFHRAPRSSSFVIDRFTQLDDVYCDAKCHQAYSRPFLDGDAVTFHCSKDVYLTGLGFCVPRDPSVVYVVDIDMFENHSKLYYLLRDKHIVYHKKDTCYQDIMFRTPLSVRRGVQCTVLQKFHSHMRPMRKSGTSIEFESPLIVRQDSFDVAVTIFSNTHGKCQGHIGSNPHAICQGHIGIPRLHFKLM